MSPKEFEAHLRQVDKRLLLYCIAGLMTGKIGMLGDLKTASKIIQVVGMEWENWVM